MSAAVAMARPEPAAPEARWTDLVDKLQRALPYRRRAIAEAHLNLAFLAGHQWTTVEPSGQVAPVDNPTNETRLVHNVMKPYFERRQQLFFQEKPVMEAYAGGGDLGDEEAALVATQLSKYWDANCGLDDAKREASEWTDVAGLSFLDVSWHAGARSRKAKRYHKLDQPEEVEGPNGLKRLTFLREEEFDLPDGDLRFEAYTAWQVIPFPINPTSWRRVNACLIVDVVDLEYLRRYLDQDVSAASLTPLDEGMVDRDILKSVARYARSAFARPAEDTQPDAVYLLLQWRERPSPAHPKGRFLLAAGGRVFYDGELPYADAAALVDPNDNENLALGLVPCQASRFPGRLAVPAPLSDMRAPQAYFNRVLSDEAANRASLGRNKLIYREGQLEDDAVTNEHGEMVRWRGTRDEAPPTIVQAQPLVGLVGEQERAEQRLIEIAGLANLLLGRNEKNVRSAFHLAILKEEAGLPMAAASAQRERCLNRVIRLALAIAKLHYSREQIVAIYGRDRANHALSFLTADIRTDVQIQEGSMLPRNHAAIDAQILELFRYGFYARADGSNDTRMARSQLTLGTLLEEVDPDEARRAQARRENARLMEGLVLPIEEEHDHDLHLEAHLDWMARREYEEAPPATKVLFQWHIAAHRNALVEAQLASAPPPPLLNPQEPAPLGEDLPDDNAAAWMDQAGAPAPLPMSA